ncbi:MAG: phosphatase PAP2 family protein [Spirochaetales bacterium]|nr:phosphatase PAP2 family protein [Spirochaetales bacterium]
MEKIVKAFEEGFGYDILLWFQSWRTDFIGWIFAPFNYIGTEFFFIGLIAIMYWLINKQQAQRVSLVFLFTMWVNAFCKAWWKRPRPYMVSVEGKQQVNLFKPFAPLESYGIPSGHTMSAGSFFGYLAFDTKKKWLRAIFLALVLLMPISRLVHGFHFMQDVVSGLLLTLIILVIYAFVEDKIFEAFYNAPIWKSALVVISVCAILLLTAIPIKPTHHSFKELVSLNAILCFGMLGFILENKVLKFSVAGVWWKKLLRLLTGFAGVAIVYLGLKFAFSFSEKNENLEVLYFIFRYIRYGLLGFWVSFGAPWFFVKIKLADKE